MAEMNIQRNAHVITAEGELGRVKHVIIDHQTKEVTDIVVGEDGHEAVIPMSAVQSVEGERVTLRGTRSTYAAGGRFDMNQYHRVDEDEVREETERTAQRGGAPLVDAKKNEVEVAGKQQTTSDRERVQSGREQVQSEREQPYRLRLREEHLRATKTREQAGEVKLGKKVVEHEETIDVPVTEERVIIERRVASGQTPARGELGKDERIDVPVMKEKVNIQKEAVVSEEVNVRKETTQRNEQVQGTVRKEELDVKDQDHLVTERGRPSTADETTRQAEQHRSRP